jgi:hypothetical protein
LKGRSDEAIFCSPAKAGAQERQALHFCWPGKEPLLRSGLDPGLRRGAMLMKPMNVWSMVILLIVVVALVIWLKP